MCPYVVQLFSIHYIMQQTTDKQCNMAVQCPHGTGKTQRVQSERKTVIAVAPQIRDSGILTPIYADDILNFLCIALAYFHCSCQGKQSMR